MSGAVSGSCVIERGIRVEIERGPSTLDVKFAQMCHSLEI